MEKGNRLSWEMTLQEVADFYGCCLRSAQSRVLEVKKYFNLQHKKRITRLHLYRYEGMSSEDIEDLVLD